MWFSQTAMAVRLQFDRMSFCEMCLDFAYWCHHHLTLLKWKNATVLDLAAFLKIYSVISWEMAILNHAIYNLYRKIEEEFVHVGAWLLCGIFLHFFTWLLRHSWAKIKDNRRAAHTHTRVHTHTLVTTQHDTRKCRHIVLLFFSTQLAVWTEVFQWNHQTCIL